MSLTSTSARLKDVADGNLMKFNWDKSKVLHLKEEPQAKIGWGSALQDWQGVWQTESRTQASSVFCEQRQVLSCAILTGTEPEDWGEVIISFYTELVRQHLEYCVLVLPVQERHQTTRVWWRATKTVGDWSTGPMRGGWGNQAHSAWRVKGFREA